MYKCTECEREYEIKPDFCDCGNDEFIPVKNAEEMNVQSTNIKQTENIRINKRKRI